MVGHDIRNPLQAMLSDVYLIKDDLSLIPHCAECAQASTCLGESSKQGMLESLQSLEENISYVNKIVQDLQDYARPLSPSRVEVDIEKLFQDVLVTRAVPKSIKVTTEVKENAKKILTDHDLLKRALTNLVNNAVQAMPNGGNLDLQAYLDVDAIIITVQDTGNGIPEEIKPKLFTPLFTTKSKGQGFGLAVVKRMAEALGGSVSFESQLGKGTKFIIKLPSK
jgi:signal transduction histidine kinase